MLCGDHYARIQGLLSKSDLSDHTETPELCLRRECGTRYWNAKLTDSSPDRAGIA